MRCSLIYAGVLFSSVFTTSARADEEPMGLDESPSLGTEGEEETGLERPSDRTSEGSGSDTDASEPWLALALNVAGFGFFGPSVVAEVGGTVTGYVTLRPFALGLLGHSLFTEENETLRFDSVGGGLGARYYVLSERAFDGLYVGAAAEMVRVGIDNDLMQFGSRHNVAVLVGEAGYRLRNDRWLFGAGGRLGYAFELSSRCDPHPGSAFSCETLPWGGTVYGEVVLDVGVVF